MRLSLAEESLETSEGNFSGRAQILVKLQKSVLLA